MIDEEALRTAGAIFAALTALALVVWLTHAAWATLSAFSSAATTWAPPAFSA